MRGFINSGEDTKGSLPTVVYSTSVVFSDTVGIISAGGEEGSLITCCAVCLPNVDAIGVFVSGSSKSRSGFSRNLGKRDSPSKKNFF